MLSPELVKEIAKRCVSTERLDAMAGKAYEEHCTVLRNVAGLNHLKSWAQAGPVVQMAWKMAAAGLAEEVLAIIVDVGSEVQALLDPSNADGN